MLGIFISNSLLEYICCRAACSATPLSIICMPLYGLSSRCVISIFAYHCRSLFRFHVLFTTVSRKRYILPMTSSGPCLYYPMHSLIATCLGECVHTNSSRIKKILWISCLRSEGIFLFQSCFSQSEFSTGPVKMKNASVLVNGQRFCLIASKYEIGVRRSCVSVCWEDSGWNWYCDCRVSWCIKNLPPRYRKCSCKS